MVAGRDRSHILPVAAETLVRSHLCRFQVLIVRFGWEPHGLEKKEEELRAEPALSCVLLSPSGAWGDAVLTFTDMLWMSRQKEMRWWKASWGSRVE